jgi:hypothetical protein
VHRFLVKDPDVGWVSIESESHIPINDRAWRTKLDQQIAEMKLKDKYSFSMEFKGESYLAMILPGMERVNEEVREGPHKYDYDPKRLTSYSKWLFPQNDIEEAALKIENASERKQALLKFAS